MNCNSGCSINAISPEAINGNSPSAQMTTVHGWMMSTYSTYEYICVCVVCTCTCTYKRVYKHLYSRDTSMLHREQRISYALITSAAFAIIIEWAYHTHAPMPFALEYIYIYIYHIYYNSQQPLSGLRLRPCICCELPSFSDLDVLIIILSGAVHTHNAHCTWAVASFSSCYCHHGIINVVVVVVLSRLPHPRSSSKWLGRINANIK